MKGDDFFARLERVASGAEVVSRETNPPRVDVDVLLEAHGLTWAISPTRRRAAEYAARGVALLTYSDVSRLAAPGAIVPRDVAIAIHATAVAFPGSVVHSARKG